jgi:hypothetical protein
MPTTTTDLSALVAEANAMLPPGMVLTPADWAQLDSHEHDPPAYLAELGRIIANHAASDGNSPQPLPPNTNWADWLTTTLAETTGKPRIATTPLALLGDNFPPHNLSPSPQPPKNKQKTRVLVTATLPELTP